MFCFGRFSSDPLSSLPARPLSRTGAPSLRTEVRAERTSATRATREAAGRRGCFVFLRVFGFLFREKASFFLSFPSLSFARSQKKTKQKLRTRSRRRPGRRGPRARGGTRRAEQKSERRKRHRRASSSSSSSPLPKQGRPRRKEQNAARERRQRRRGRGRGREDF